MADIFLRLFNRSIAAGWLILAVILLRLLLKKTPKWISCLLWGLVAVRLVCPFSIESVYSLIPSERALQSETVIEGEFQQEIPAVDTRMSATSRILNPVLSEMFVSGEEEHAISWLFYRNIAGIVWCCGFSLLSAYAMINWCRIRHMVKEAVRYKDNIYYCDAVASPFIFGIVRARIYLPSSIDINNITHVLRHEQAHLKRKDHWWKPLGYMLLSVYWFQPLCWVAYFIFCRDIEFACDEKVIRAMSLNEKKEYAKALLSYGLQRKIVMTCPVAFGEISVKKRIKSVLYYRKRPVWIVVPAIAVCMVAAVCFLTNPPHEIRGASVAAGGVGTGKPENASIETGSEIMKITDIIKNNIRFDKERGEETAQINGEITNSEVASITVINGNNGERLSYSRLDSSNAFKDLLQLYSQLNCDTDIEENSRVGYRYYMTLYDKEGNVLHMVTPYKDGFTIDNIFYAYNGSFGYDKASVALMNYMDLLFYPARSMLLDEEEKMRNTIGVRIVLPENTNWIKDIRYYYKDSNSMEIQYYDAILEADCTLYAVQNGTVELPDITFDKNLEESWEGWTADSQRILIQLQRSEDGRNVLVAWEYNDAQFVMQAVVSDINADVSPLPKTAIYIIQNFQAGSSSE